MGRKVNRIIHLVWEKDEVINYLIKETNSSDEVHMLAKAVALLELAVKESNQVGVIELGHQRVSLRN